MKSKVLLVLVFLAAICQAQTVNKLDGGNSFSWQVSGAATDDLLRYNGTNWVPLIKGGNNTVLGVNGAGVFGYKADPSGGVSDGDKGDITVSASGATWMVDPASVTLAKMADMASASLIYRKTAGSGAPEVNTLATLKTDLALVKADVGLGNVDNTSDASKPVSTATQSALDAKQATLVSATNIKTINGASVLGSGDLVVTGAVMPLYIPIAVPVLAALAWTNQPAALSFWLSTATVAKGTTLVDLTNYTQVRLLVNKQGTSGAAAAKLILRYKASPWTQVVANYSDIGTSEVSVAINVNNTFLDTGWINLAAGAKADVFIDLLGSGGDGTLDPAFGYIVAVFK